MFLLQTFLDVQALLGPWRHVSEQLRVAVFKELMVAVRTALRRRHGLSCGWLSRGGVGRAGGTVCGGGLWAREAGWSEAMCRRGQHAASQGTAGSPRRATAWAVSPAARVEMVLEGDPGLC